MLRRLLRHAFTPRRGRAARAPGDAVVFVANADRPMRVHPGAQLTAALASTRLRVLLPALQIAQRAPVYIVPPQALRKDRGLRAVGKPRAIVMSKFSTAEVAQAPDQFGALLDWLASWRGRVPLIADLSDNFAAAAERIAEPFLAEYQRALLDTCTVTVPCEALRAELAPGAAHGVRVIEDPYERETAAEVRTRPGDPLRLVWFGMLNEPAQALLRPALRAIARRFPERPIGVDVVTLALAAELLRGWASEIAALAPQLTLRLVPWSLAAAQQAVERADFVLLPQDAQSAWGRVKSHNRLVEAIRGGRLALAAPIPSYLELRECAWIGEDCAEGLAWALAHAEEAAQRVAHGQRYVEERFAPAVIGRKWLEALGIASA